MAKQKNKSKQTSLPKLVLLGLSGLAFLFAGLMYGNDIVLFNPKGQIAQNQAHLMEFSVAVMLAFAIPVLGMLYFFAWKYRESNSKVRNRSTKPHGKLFGMSLWVAPTIIVIILASVVLPATFNLDPRKKIEAQSKPLTIRVVALRWKWLFIYPEQNIATVNYVQLPVNVPVQFELTADEAPMNSFWIPHLGGQLYAMTGHQTELNLMADAPGDYQGQAAEINGPGFAGMKFTAHAASAADFDEWVKTARASQNQLTAEQYQKLLVPSENNPVILYSKTDTNLYKTILTKYNPPPDANVRGEQ